MRLITAHRILIAAGIAFFVFYAVFQLRLYVREGSVTSVAQAGTAVIIAGGFVWYYRSLRGR